jgi:signal transduction histidine kinase
VALLRTAQEALANVARHAEATRVGLTLSYMEHEVALDVRDDGRGFEPAQLDAGNGVAINGVTVTGQADGGPKGPVGPEPAGEDPGGGFGLVAMRQRIEGLLGTLQVESEPGVGTTISACVPEAHAQARA